MHGRRGVFPYPNGEIYVGQWAAEADAGADALPQRLPSARGDAPAAGRGSPAVNFMSPLQHLAPSRTPPASESCDTSSTGSSSPEPGRGRRTSGKTLGGLQQHSGRAAPRREGWGVHLRGHEKYEGEWRSDFWHGVGSVVVKGGERYFGQFSEGSRSGTGVSVSQLGVLHAETWVAGRLARRRPLFRGPGHARAGSGGSGGSRPSQPASHAPEDSASGSASSASRPSSPGSPRASLPGSPQSPDSGLQPRGGPSPARSQAQPGPDADAPHSAADVERSSLRSMCSWTPREVARLVRKLGLGAAPAATLRAHHVSGATLATFTSDSASRFLQTVFDDEGAARPGAARAGSPTAPKRLLVLAVRQILNVRRKLLENHATPSELREEFSDLEIDERELQCGDRIGEGGYGCVYRARWMHTDVAAKFFRAREGHVSADFYQELTLLRRLRHPNITLLIGYAFRGQYIIVTELVQRGNLYDLLHRQRHLPGFDVLRQQRHLPSFGQEWTFSNVVDIAREICLGMIYLHSNEVVHRDLKSSNVLLNGPRHVKLCDFGLSYLLSDSNPRVGVVGTHNWMAPEVLRGEQFTKAADVYSFGMILWEMISRKVPFERYTFAQVVGLVGYGRRRPAMPQSCPEPLRDLLQRVLRPRPRSRPSFQELSEDLRRVHHSAVIDVEESLWTFLTG